MSANTPPPPFLILCMGVSGCGKSTLAAYLANKLSCAYLEADDFHSELNKSHMASGKPLTDAMREPWIQAMCDHLRNMHNQGKSAVLAYSGLRSAHRQRFRQLGYPTLFLHLEGPKSLIQERISARAGHFMPPALLDSQYAALESTDSEPDVYGLDLTQQVEDIARQAESITSVFLKETKRSHIL